MNDLLLKPLITNVYNIVLKLHIIKKKILK